MDITQILEGQPSQGASRTLTYRNCEIKMFIKLLSFGAICYEAIQ